MSPFSTRVDPSGGDQPATEVLRQLLAEERARSDQLLEAMTAWQLRARLAEERLLALSGAAPAQAERRRPAPAPSPAETGRAQPPPKPAERPAVDQVAGLPAAPAGDPVFKRHPLYRGRRYRQLVEDFTNEASGAQRQYATLAAKPDRARRDEIALGLLDAEWAAIGGTDWPKADPRWLAAQRARFEYRFEVGKGRSAGLDVSRPVVLALIGVALVVVALALIVAFG